MLQLNDYLCQCGTLFEELADPNTPQQVKCPDCGQLGIATKQLSAPRIDPLLGLDATGFPTMGDKWVRRKKQHQTREERRKREHGD